MFIFQIFNFLIQISVELFNLLFPFNGFLLSFLVIILEYTVQRFQCFALL